MTGGKARSGALDRHGHALGSERTQHGADLVLIRWERDALCPAAAARLVTRVVLKLGIEGMNELPGVVSCHRLSLRGGPARRVDHRL